MQGYLLVFLGAGIGGAFRHAVNLATARLLPTTMGVSTLIVNVVGSFAMGLLIEWLASKGSASDATRLFLATGVLGGFTTFSAFGLETWRLLEGSAFLAAAGNAVGSVVVCVASVALGVALGRAG